jgi:murein DD-endopeptidase MepM/ murein hydrolase activator NlpD
MTRFLALIFCLIGILKAAPLDLCLPTENQHLFTGEMNEFYMYVDRNFEGQTTKPWQAGCYGFVRSAVRINGEMLLTKFHEGIDICPMKRDAAGNPLDLVASIAAGRVAYVSPIAGRSNYGKYVVIEHPWENSSVISLYAHLAEITCKPGDPVGAGTVIGKMGFTGAGIDRTRAHCHLELGMLMSVHYEEWRKKFGGSENFHGNYNGMNITGAEVSRFFLEQKANPELQFSQFIASTPVYFKVTVPAHGTPDFVKRYPWICHGDATSAVSWEISFSATGLPVAFNSSSRPVSAPTVTSIRPSNVPHRYLTRGLISGEGNQATLSNSGKQLVSLLTDDILPTPLPTP